MIKKLIHHNVVNHGLNLSWENCSHLSVPQYINKIVSNKRNTCEKSNKKKEETRILKKKKKLYLTTLRLMVWGRNEQDSLSWAYCLAWFS